MQLFLVIIHLVVAFCIIALVLMQQGRGADMGASFGSGSSQTVFGSAGSVSFFAKMTGVLVAVFFVTSFGLAIFSGKSVQVTDASDLPFLAAPVESAPATVPEIPTSPANSVESPASDVPAE